MTLNSNTSISEIVETFLDEDGRVTLPIPDSVSDAMNLNIGDIVDFIPSENDTIIFRKKQMKFTMHGQHYDYNTMEIDPDASTSVQFKADNLYTVIERFEEFLRGCGFVFKGHLEIVDEMGSEISGSGYNSF